MNHFQGFMVGVYLIKAVLTGKVAEEVRMVYSLP
jgi:hypothetical protein